LERSAADYALKHGASTTFCIGTIDGSPSVMLIGEPTEAGDQQYELLLRDEYHSTIKVDTSIPPSPTSDALFILGQYAAADAVRLLEVDPPHLHLDLGNFNGDVTTAAPQGCSTVFASTSSPMFLTDCQGDAGALRARLMRDSKSVVFKENRGGVRYWSSDQMLATGAHVRSVVHSVGVGDCFDVVFTHLRTISGEQAALAYASLIAAEYASTTFVDDFRMAVQRCLQLSPDEATQLPGISLPWESRRAINVYIAGPDFDYMDREAIERTTAALSYHNFTPRRPVLENGQINRQSTKTQRRGAFLADTDLMRQCQIMVAVLPFDDPGTLIEIGMAAATRMPVILYDPLARATNVMLTEAPSEVATRLDDVIGGVFREASRVVNG
jgi:nucleoside 2-deoxyribosyltransferase